MFRKAIKDNTSYIKPLLTCKVIYENRQIVNLINSLIVINLDGYILTCSSTADYFFDASEINEVYLPILETMIGKKIKEIAKTEKKYGINRNSIVGMYNILIDISDEFSDIAIIKHPYLDMAILKVEHLNQNFISSLPIFDTRKNEIGTSICNLGYAFPEYETFEYIEDTEKMVTTNKKMNFPLFPFNGIITRNIVDGAGKISMFETSIPSFPGQNGGPVLNLDGKVIGMQAGNKNIHLNHNKNKVHDINLGFAINAKEIADFLDKNKIFYNKL